MSRIKLLSVISVFLFIIIGCIGCDSDTGTDGEKSNAPQFKIYFTDYENIESDNPLLFPIGTVINLPVPEKEGYIFDGWYDNGIKVSSPYTITKETTLIAHWTFGVYTVTFDNASGITPVSTSFNTAITLPIPSEKTGYTFDGWYDGKGIVSSPYHVTKDITLTARWIPYTYSVSFDVTGIRPILADYNSSITLPIPEPKEYYTFDGWYDGSTRVNSPYTVLDNVTLSSKWLESKTYQIILFDNFTSITPPDNPITAELGSEIILPVPEKEGFIFEGWYNNETKVSDPYIVNEDAVLTANWKIITFTATFDNVSGIDPVTANYNESITLPEIVLKTGYTFAGWYDDGIKVSSPYAVTKDVTLKAAWTINQYTVAFNSDGGSAVSSQTKDYNTSIALSNPTKTGYAFAGWYDGSTRVSNPYIITKNVTLKASWTMITYTVSFDSKGGSNVSSQIIEYGKTAYTPTNPTRSWYNFSHWELNGSKFNFNAAITGNITLTAKWTEQSYSTVITTSGTWTPPLAGTYQFELWGGGGGGGRNYTNAYGGGGGSGYSAESTIAVTVQAYSVIIGNGGAQGTSNTNAGFSGGQTSISALGIYANGGGGGGGGCGTSGAPGKGGAGGISGTHGLNSLAGTGGVNSSGFGNGGNGGTPGFPGAIRITKISFAN
ncbi:MAG: InlB B-repeat-containing protein [Deferribacteraceae bacterium]|nr:InlB B-repeat-containing protein [Deferribacteraceae bacterium]